MMLAWWEMGWWRYALLLVSHIPGAFEMFASMRFEFWKWRDQSTSGTGTPLMMVMPCSRPSDFMAFAASS